MEKRTKIQLSVYTKYRFLRKVLPDISYCFNNFVLCRIDRLKMDEQELLQCEYDSKCCSRGTNETCGFGHYNHM